ncbi:Deoxyribose-phosphate aldolase\phospho-2-dehydro- 3-deoxyheptonate aldolase [Sodalis praecaptivus]|uniref:Deoxyribose-phosphate aldolase\phospho-2-dehydro-3-deoxyheptonate aldolase n=2 Tax=Bruguierivoracaceae TaxID=2812006 RepID=W0HTB4_9GAMM|nr:Deoxyribose-phosphate aldolase\phospho-2-dehydro- 3-deoxyheptonate aldolase [Sodalis praecaptivus]
MDSRTGKAIRMGRLLRPETGHAVVVAASHGVMSGPPSGLRTRQEIANVFTQLRAADGVMVSPGMIPLVENTFIGRDRPAFVLHLDWKNHARSIYTPGKDGRGEGVLAQLAEIDEVAASGIDAVMTYLYLGQKDTALEQAEIVRNTRIARDCERHGIALIIEPRSALEGVDPDALSAKVMSLYCRIAADLGADLVKALWPGSVEAFGQITDTCYTPILLAGGAGGDDPLSTLQLASDAMQAGAKGVMFGRRVFRAEQPAQVLSALAAVVHDNQSVEQASRLLER